MKLTEVLKHQLEAPISFTQQVLYSVARLLLYGLGSKEKMKLTFLKDSDNSLSKYLIFKRNFLHAMAVLCYLPKLKRGLGLAFGAYFLHDFSIKMFLI